MKAMPNENGSGSTAIEDAPAPAVTDQSSSPADPAGSLVTSMSTSSTCSSSFASGGNDDFDDTWYICSESEISEIMTGASLQSSMSDDSSTQIRTTIQIPEVITSSTSAGSRVTLYKINIESTDICFHTPSSCVWRSYSDFVWLRKRINSSCSFMKRTIPDLPSRNLLNLFDKDFAVTRRLGLQEFLRQVVEDRSLLSDAALHLFLQSNLKTEEIQEWLEGKTNDTVLQLIQRGKGLETQHGDIDHDTRHVGNDVSHAESYVINAANDMVHVHAGNDM